MKEHSHHRFFQQGRAFSSLWPCSLISSVVEYITFFPFLVIIETICIFIKPLVSVSVQYKVMGRHGWYMYILQWYNPKINWQCDAIFTLAIFSERWLGNGYSRSRMCWERDNKEGRSTKKFLHIAHVNRSGLFSIGRGTILPPFLGSICRKAELKTITFTEVITGEMHWFYLEYT